MERLPPAPLPRGWAQERAARTRGWLAAQSPSRALRRAPVTPRRHVRRCAVGYALDQRLACSLRPIFCALGPFPAAMAMLSAASTLVRTGVIMPHRNSCLKRASPAPISHGAGLPYPRRTRDWDHAPALRSSTTLSPVSPQTNDAHDARMGRLSSSIEVRRSGSRCCRWRAPNGDRNVEPAKQHAHRHRAGQPHRPTGNNHARSLA